MIYYKETTPQVARTRSERSERNPRSFAIPLKNLRCTMQHIGQHILHGPAGGLSSYTHICTV